MYTDIYIYIIIKIFFPKRFFLVKQFLSYSAKIRKIIVKNAPVSVLFQLMIGLDP